MAVFSQAGNTPESTIQSLLAQALNNHTEQSERVQKEAEKLSTAYERIIGHLIRGRGDPVFFRAGIYYEQIDRDGYTILSQTGNRLPPDLYTIGDLSSATRRVSDSLATPVPIVWLQPTLERRNDTIANFAAAITGLETGTIQDIPSELRIQEIARVFRQPVQKPELA